MTNLLKNTHLEILDREKRGIDRKNNICGRRWVVVDRYRMICLVLILYIPHIESTIIWYFEDEEKNYRYLSFSSKRQFDCVSLIFDVVRCWVRAPIDVDYLVDIYFTMAVSLSFFGSLCVRTASLHKSVQCIKFSRGALNAARRGMSTLGILVVYFHFACFVDYESLKRPDTYIESITISFYVYYFGNILAMSTTFVMNKDHGWGFNALMAHLVNHFWHDNLQIPSLDLCLWYYSNKEEEQVMFEALIAKK